MRNALARFIALAAVLAPAAAAAEDISRDRAEFNAASSVRLSPAAVAETEPARPPQSRRAEPAAERRQERRAVRVVLPSPYGR